MSEPITGNARAQTPTRVIDLSRGGALFEIARPLEVGGIHDFALDLDGVSVWVQAEVRRCHRAETGAGYHVGVEFVGIDPGDARTLDDYLAREHG